jgi:acetoin utilization deacetylase AcuC-like enzyme
VLLQGEPRVTTFSLHCAGNFFSDKQRSDLDVEVPAGSGDGEYLALLQEHLPPLFERVKPDLTFFQVSTKYQVPSTKQQVLSSK